jgi:hypothetical protein
MYIVSDCNRAKRYDPFVTVFALIGRKMVGLAVHIRGVEKITYVK